MNNWHHMLEHSASLCSNKICKIVDLLNTTFKVKYFYFHRLYVDGSYICMTNNTELNHFWIANTNIKTNPFVNHPDGVRGGVYLAEYQESSSVKIGMEYAEKNYGVSSMLSLIQKNDDFYDLFVFGTNVDRANAYPFYFNEIPLLDKFTNYFTSESSFLINKLLCRPVNMFNELVRFDQPECELVGMVKSENEIEFLKVVEKYHRRIGCLTKRELECVYHFAQRRTAKETAAILNLSPRTVENYYENVKSKLGCQKKREILEVLQIN